MLKRSAEFEIQIRVGRRVLQPIGQFDHPVDATLDIGTGEGKLCEGGPAFFDFEGTTQFSNSDLGYIDWPKPSQLWPVHLSGTEYGVVEFDPDLSSGLRTLHLALVIEGQREIGVDDQ